jgi:hypothetical protein
MQIAARKKDSANVHRWMECKPHGFVVTKAVKSPSRIPKTTLRRTLSMGPYTTSGSHREGWRASILPNMDYDVGSRIRVKLYSGQIMEAEITAIVNQSAGRKIRIFYDSKSVVINPEQIIEILSTT